MVALVGLSVYIVIDYNKYKTVVAKLKKLEGINSSELAVETPTVETLMEEKPEEDVQSVEEKENILSKKGGKHF